ncbi:MAG: Hsp33 family molecular chaperone HslO [Gammaproteobacteria bacterium]|nr:Hsp33 family molecular chaperone HslO [Gammaproteobacteria bacterium]MBQ0838424.1 Hsp33 family molecular chaperone HslO [Gammaproteobacteria bacterium]
MSQPDNDLLQRFLFEQSDVRGEIVSLQDSYQAVLANHKKSNQRLPAAIDTLLGEFLSAAALLSATLKFDGIITLQAKPKDTGALDVIMADCTRHNNLRAVARYDASKAPTDEHSCDFRSLFDGGYLVITIDPAKGERYQSVVRIEHDSLSDCLNTYFQQSEQLPTRIWLAADGHRASGLLLQALPVQLQSLEQRSELWQHLCLLADTLKADEQVALSHHQQLHRLFHQETLQFFEPTALQFSCTCSRVRTASMLISLGEAEITAILEEQASIEVACEFCHYVYQFSPEQAAQLFINEVPTLH